MNKTLTLVLGGGRGTRLYPLTRHRAKPAVPVAGKYRLIDIPLSNCINSGLNRIYVLTQFNSRQPAPPHPPRPTSSIPSTAASSRSWPPSKPSTMPTGIRAPPTPSGRTSATSEQPGIEYVLILSGDQLYRMDFADMLPRHHQARRRRDDRRRAGRQQHGRRRWASCGWTTPAAWSASWRSRKTDARDGPSSAPTRPGSTPAASRAAAATAWPAWASTCSTATRWSTC